ncbi:MAG: aldehyde ferredoxin oxidoreductase family protein [Deltaproteobacteria bacterium]|nr:aldehyde ferredoxin oxidoreductase family protein [Deltaproteobacteria bacterium]MBW2139001.1 aldehyde ferredoxin oxidoreductase family protein [Deltaproteobacteria bacterium]
MEYKSLILDLSSRSFETEEIPEDIIRKYIGGRGLGSYLLYRHVPGGADPLDEENCLIFTAGPASGTGLFYTPKANVSTKSPLTGIYLYSISSGILAAQMRRAGLWAIIIKGVADSPTYVQIDNQDVRFEDASTIWGFETAAAQKEMLKGADPRKVATVGIGPAGEQRIPSAAIFTDGPLYRCFGRGGAGAVMGSKNLKGMLVTGDGEISVADPESLSSIRRRMAQLLKTDLKGWADWWRAYETASDLEKMNELGILPTKNWQQGQFQGWMGIDKSTTPMGWPEKGRACGPNCPTPGCREVEVKEGPYKGARSDFEWETIYAFGSTCAIDKMEPIVAASQICDEAGVDTMTAGITIGFAMECFEKGLITSEDTDGIELRFGNDSAMITALKKLVKQEGFGKRLAMGTRRLSSEIKGSEAFAMQVKGMELGGYECRGLNGQALQFAIDNRGGCHHGYGLPARMEIFDNTRLDLKGKGEYVKKAAISRILRDSMIVCTFTPLYKEEMVSEVLTALFGKQWPLDAMEEAGLRIMAQERLFNMREGITSKDDTLPERLLKEPKPDGPTKGEVVPLEELKEDYYGALGYDLSTGNPTEEHLKKLGIET